MKLPIYRSDNIHVVYAAVLHSLDFENMKLTQYEPDPICSLRTLGYQIKMRSLLKSKMQVRTGTSITLFEQEYDL